MQRTCCFGSPVAQASFWLMIVSSTTAVLPVCRSPITSCRCPRPIGVMASMALIPVCSGSFTDCRCTTVGACSSRARRAGASTGRGASAGGAHGAAAAEGFAPRAAPPPEEALANRNGEPLAGAADLLALLDGGEVTQDDDA